MYGRFLEYIKNEPGAAGRFFEAAVKAGTSESLLALTSAEGGAAGLAAAGQIDEKTDGLVVINAQVSACSLPAAANAAMCMAAMLCICSNVSGCSVETTAAARLCRSEDCICCLLLLPCPQGIIMMVNSAAVTMFGYQKGELEGKNVSVLM